MSTVRKASPSRRAQNKLDKRERIRKAAFELFVKHGFDATTTKAVARRAKIASGTLFLYAKDKRDLLFLVFGERLRSTVDAQMATLPRQAALLDQLMHVFGGLFRMYGEQPELSAAFVKHLPGAQGPNADSVNGLTLSFLHQVSMLVQSAQTRGEVDAEVPPMVAAGNIFSLYFGALMTWLSGFATLEAALEPGLRDALSLQIRGLSPR
ncbi:MAG: TetR/AcrR family transcriptional regulator [Myxococcales bacterium]|nr:TetR/AcrR family transcriptional regulator [Myxococcales bacterium]MCB9577328.1 TetR/AcrR family transcriptional regulator [Polyangiaceae bacterium]